MSQLTTAGGREFQVAGAAQLKDYLPMPVRLKGTSRSGTAGERSDRVSLRALMCRLRYAGLTIAHGAKIKYENKSADADEFVSKSTKLR